MYIHAATNPQNNICNLDSTNLERISGYMRNGNKANYRNLARFIRRDIGRKKFFAEEAQSVAASVSDAFFHVDEQVSFENIDDYETYLRKLNCYTEGAGRIAVVAGIHDPFSGNKEHLDSLIVSCRIPD